MVEDKRYGSFFFLLLMIVVLVAVAMTVLTVNHIREIGAANIFSNQESILVNDGWSVIHEDGSIEEFTGFNKRLTEKEITLSRIFIFSENSNRDMLTFLVRHCAVQVFQDGALVYAHGDIEDVRSGNLPGIYTVNAELDARRGEASEIVVKFVASNYIKLNNFEFGNSQRIQISQFLETLPIVIFSVSFLILILLMAMIAIFGRRSFRLPNAYYYFMTFLLFCSIWVMSDGRILQYSGMNSAVNSIITTESLMILTLPFWGFMFLSYTNLRKFDIIAIIVVFLNFIILNILHFSGSANFFKTAWVTHVITFLSIVFAAFQGLSLFVVGSST